MIDGMILLLENIWLNGMGNDMFKNQLYSAEIRTQPTLVEIFRRARGQGLIHTLVDLYCCNPTPLHFWIEGFPPCWTSCELCIHERPTTSLIVGNFSLQCCNVNPGIMVYGLSSPVSEEYTVKVIDGLFKWLKACNGLTLVTACPLLLHCELESVSLLSLL